MKIYNTLSKKIEEFIPYNKNEVTMYTCGPTVYHYAHIGNLRTYITEDILEKSLLYLGYNVKRVMNITDVGHLSSDADTGEDKMLKGAKREHKTVLEIADFYTKCFQEDCQKLNIKWPETVIPATTQIDYYIDFIKVLMDKGYAYFDWNISSGDAGGTTNPKTEVKIVTSNLSKKRGNVILMHDIKKHTSLAIEDIVKYGLNNGYTFDVLDKTIKCHQKIAN